MPDITPITKYRTPDGNEHPSEEQARHHMTAVNVLRALGIASCVGDRYNFLMDVQKAGFTIRDERLKAAESN